MLLFSGVIWTTTSQAEPLSRDFAERRPVKIWTTEHGLPQNWILSLAQTPDGALWVGTGTALARFDGVRFEQFDLQNTPALPSVNIERLHVDKGGALWISAGGRPIRWTREQDFQRLDDGFPQRGRIKNFFEVGDALWLWTYKGELLRFDGAGWIEDTKPNAEASKSNIFLVDSDRQVGRFVDGRLELLRTTDGKPLISTWAYLDPDGILWIQDQGEHGLLRFIEDPERRSFRLLDHIETPGRSTRPSRVAQGELWCGIENQGLFRRQDGRWHHVAGRNNVLQLLEDREGNLWAGTPGDGLIQILPPPKFRVLTSEDGLSHDEVRTALEEPDGTLWLGTRDGLSRIRGDQVENLTGTRLSPKNPKLTYARIGGLARDSTGRLWALGKILYFFDGSDWTPLMADKPVSATALMNTPAGEVWFNGPRGIEKIVDADGLKDPSKRILLGSVPGTVRTLMRDRQRTGRTWIGSRTGLYIHDPNVGSTAQPTLRLVTDQVGVVSGLHLEKSGDLWIASRDKGLFRLRDGQLSALGTDQGLFDPTVHHVLDDGLGYFWLPGDRGLTRVSIEDLHAVADGRAERFESKLFGLADGLLSLEFNSGIPGPSRLRDGRLVFPTMKGLAVVDPARMPINETPPTVEISGLSAEYSDIPLTPELRLARELRLNPEQRSIGIRYTAMSFVAPQATRFRYRLDGFDTDWVDAGTRREAFYTLLPPGEYTFRVQAANADGIWSTEDATLKLHLPARFQETRAFTLLITAFVLLLAWGLGRWHRTRRHELELEAQVAERTAGLEQEKAKTEAQAQRLEELGRLKNRFFANVSHELRTPLTLLKAPLAHALDAEPSSPKAPDSGLDHGTLRLMRRNAERLEQRIDELLDLSRLEAGRWTLDCVETDAVAFTTDLIGSFEPLADAKNVSIVLRAETDLPPVWLDRADFDKVLGNLLSNAIKYSPEGGQVIVGIEAQSDSDWLHWTVTDQGPGIHEPDLERIFARFERGRRGRHLPGTGIGLALVAEIMERHRGRAGAANEPEGGSRFTLSLRQGTEHLAPEDLAPESHPSEIPANETPANETPTASTSTDLETAPNTESSPTVPSPTAEVLSPSGPAPTVLVVEDDDDLRQFLRSLLAPRFGVVEAGDGSEALELAQALVPDLVLSDVSMPTMDGNTLAEKLRENDVTDHIPIVFLTARSSTEHRVGSLRQGVDAYLTKPFEPRELLACIDGLLANRERLRRRFTDRSSLPSLKRPEVQSEADRFLARVLDAVDKELSNPEFGVYELADQLALSRRQLHRKLQNLTGESPSELIRRLRLERAHALLEQKTGNINEIATAVGFTKPAYFSKIFRNAYGYPPSAVGESSPS